MSLPENQTKGNPQGKSDQTEIRSLKELIDRVSGKDISPMDHEVDSGIADRTNYPFLAIVGQDEMKLALILTVINPLIGGVLLVGPRGTGKTTAVRSLVDILPENTVSNCFYGCLPVDIENHGIDAVCPECAQKYAKSIPLTKQEQVHLVELPLNAELETVIGGIDERQLAHQRMRLKRGILSYADQNLLYIDEVNLLQDEIINSILDAAAMGKYTVRRGSVFITYRSRFTLIGSMNPEEGKLRPQIMDRFGLRVITKGLQDSEERKEAYLRSSAYRKNPQEFIEQYSSESQEMLWEIQTARNSVWQVTIPDNVVRAGIRLIQSLSIESLRAEMTLFEAAKAYAAADHRDFVTVQDLAVVAPMSLRLRSSSFYASFFSDQRNEEEDLISAINNYLKER